MAAADHPSLTGTHCGCCRTTVACAATHTSYRTDGTPRRRDARRPLQPYSTPGDPARATRKQKILEKVILGPVARHLVGPDTAVPCCQRMSRDRTCGIIGSTAVIRALSCGVGMKRLPAALDSNKVRSRRSDSRKWDRTVKPSVAGVSHDPTAEERPSVVLRQLRAMNGPSWV